MSWNNFNDAEEQTSGDVIPHGTIAKVVLKLRPGGHDDPSKGWTGGIARRAEASGAVMLDCEFTVIGGKYGKRKVWTFVGLHSPKGPKWEQMGRSFIRAALESAAGIRPDDTSEKAMKARTINELADLNGLEFAAKIEVEKAEEGSQYGDKNKIQTVIPVTHKDYAAVMNGQGESAPVAAVAASAQTSQAAAPSWLNG